MVLPFNQQWLKLKGQLQFNNLVSIVNMIKSNAIKIVANCYPDITPSNTIFSNISLTESWWFELENSKFNKILYFMLSDKRHNKLYVFKIPANTIKSPEKYFQQRNDKYRRKCSDIYIPTTGTFKEKKDLFSQILS